MSRTQQFLAFLKQRQVELIDQWQVAVRIDENGSLVVSQSWPTDNDNVRLARIASMSETANE